MKIMSVVMTHGPRSRAISQNVAHLQTFTVPTDIFIWNNGPDKLTVPGATVVDGVNDCGEAQKLTLPLVRKDYDVFFYSDDDVTVHPRFVECGLRLLGTYPNFLICSGGSIIEGSDARRRRWLPSSTPSPRPFYVDFADLCCFIMLRPNVQWMFKYGLMPSQPWNTDLFFSASYWDNGGVIYVPEQPTPSRRCVQLNPEHGQGLCSRPGFAQQRNKAIRELAARGWRKKPELTPARAPWFWA